MNTGYYRAGDDCEDYIDVRLDYWHLITETAAVTVDVNVIYEQRELGLYL